MLNSPESRNLVRYLLVPLIGLLVPQLWSQQAPASIRTVSSGMVAMATTNIAPGGIITISGTNLAAGSAGLGSLTGNNLPTTLGGVQVSIGGVRAPLFMVSPDRIVAQVPFEAQAGSQPIQITRAGTTSAPFSSTVAAAVPTLFSDRTGALALRTTANSIAGAANPAASGELLVLYATGPGQTTPALQTGAIAPLTLVANTAPVTVTFGTQSTEPVYSVAAPGFAGLTQMGVRVPARVAGTVPVAIRINNVTSPPAALTAGILRAPQVDAQAQALLMQYMALGPKPIQNLTPDEARRQPTIAAAARALLQSQGRPTTPEAVARTEDRMIPGAAGQIQARFYTPAGAGPFPVIVYFHGGGFVIATIDTYDSSARAIANAAVVISVEYRKAPENKFPAAAEDAYAATQWAINNAASFDGQPDRVAVAGESASGNLATVVCQIARDCNGRRPVYQGLIYPVVNLASERPSYEETEPHHSLPGLLFDGSAATTSVPPKTRSARMRPATCQPAGPSAGDGHHSWLRPSAR